MAFAVLEQLCEPGNAARANDDACGATAHAAFVLDGATGLADTPLLLGESDAAWVAHTARDVLLGLPAVPARDAVSAVVAHLCDAFARQALRPIAERYETPSSSLCLLTGTEAALFGDCCAIAVAPDGALSFYGTSGKGRAAERARAQQHAAGDSSDWAKVRARAIGELRRLRNLINTGPGSGVLAPDPACLPLLRIKSAPLTAGSHALLMSDGFYALCEDYGLYDVAGLISAAQTKGLRALYTELRAVEESDPDGRRFPRFKKSDDATALLVKVL